MEVWNKVWTEAVAPILSIEGLNALIDGLMNDDPKLMQGRTTDPPPLMCVRDWDVEGACPIGYAYWKGDGLETVGEVEEAFAKTCFQIDESLGEPGGCRHFLNWVDESPRNEMRRKLLLAAQASVQLIKEQEQKAEIAYMKEEEMY